MTETRTTQPPLADYRVVGLQENWYQAAPDAPKQPGGSCWHCGTSIAIEVVIQSKSTGELHSIGTTCAERVGLDGPELKRLLAERYYEQRQARSASARRAENERVAAWEAEQAAAYGEHGTERRFTDGECRCDRCIAVAPHGTPQRFHFGECRCLDCLDAQVATGDYDYREYEALVDLDTGDVADARLVDTRYGMKWRVDATDEWISPSPKRRSTIASKGYTEGDVMFFVEVCGPRGRRWYKRLLPLSTPIVDSYGERIARPEATR